jgi:hypothetical protein
VSRILHAFAVLVLVVAALVVIGLVGFRLWLPSEQGRRWLSSELEHRTGMKISFDRLGGSLLWNAEVDGLRIGDDLTIPRARARWSLWELIDRRPSASIDLDLQDFRMRVRPEMIPNWIEAPRESITGDLHLSGPKSALVVRGMLRVGGGSVILDGHGSLPEQRGELEARFRGLEPHLLAADEPMLLNGAMHVRARGRVAHFTVGGVYRHRRVDPAVPVSKRSAIAGTLSGSGVIRAERNLTANFRLRVHDRGHASRLFGSADAPRETVLRGVYVKRPNRPPEMRLHTEAP